MLSSWIRCYSAATPELQQIEACVYRLKDTALDWAVSNMDTYTTVAEWEATFLAEFVGLTPREARQELASLRFQLGTSLAHTQGGA